MEEIESVEVIIIELVELEEHAKNHGTEAPHAKHYAFRVDKQRVVVSTPTITGTKILAEVGKTPEGLSSTSTSGTINRFRSARRTW